MSSIPSDEQKYAQSLVAQQSQPQAPAQPVGQQSPVVPGAETPLWDQGMVAPGNVNLHNRPTVPNGDEISTVYSATYGPDEKGLYTLAPLVSERGTMMTPEQGRKEYMMTGRHLGKFKDVDSAERYAIALHEQQAPEYENRTWDKPRSDRLMQLAQAARVKQEDRGSK